MLLQALLAVGVVFGFIAALMAFLIFFDEYRKHRLTGRRLWEQALSGAAVAFFFFLLLSLLAGGLVRYALW